MCVGVLVPLSLWRLKKQFHKLLFQHGGELRTNIWLSLSTCVLTNFITVNLGGLLNYFIMCHQRHVRQDERICRVTLCAMGKDDTEASVVDSSYYTLIFNAVINAQPSR